MSFSVKSSANFKNCVTSSPSLASLSSSICGVARRELSPYGAASVALQLFKQPFDVAGQLGKVKLGLIERRLHRR